MVSLHVTRPRLSSDSVPAHSPTAYLESDRSGELERVCRLLAALLCPAAGAEDLSRQLACVRAAAERHGRVQDDGQGQELTQLLATIVTEPRYDRLAR